MPLPTEALEKIRGHIEEAEKGIASISDVIADLRASGIDTSKQEEELRELKATHKQMTMFYGRQMKRVEGAPPPSE